MPLAREAIDAFADQDAGRIRAICAGCGWRRAPAVDLWDDERWDVLTARHVRIARELGDLTELPLVLNSRLTMHLFAGEFAAAASLLAEIRTIVDATGVGLAPYGAIGLAVCVDAWTRPVP